MIHRLSLQSAILINSNVMLGAGIFVNTTLLTHTTGALGALVYCFVAFLLVPLLLSIAELSQLYPNDGFYGFSAPVSPFVGFISAWSYFIAKLASCSLGIIVFSRLVTNLFPMTFINEHITLLNCLVVIIFTLGNLLHLKLGSSIQRLFVILKLIPILFVIVSSPFLFLSTNFTSSFQLWQGFIPSIPFVLYAFTGFEASCSLNRYIVDPQKNGYRAIIISYALGVILIILYQFILYGDLGQQLGLLTSYREVFPTLLAKLFPSTSTTHKILQAIMHLGIASSCLGAAYGIMYSNAWNLYILAKKSHIAGSQLIAQLSIHSVPLMCVFIEGLIVITYIIVCRENQIPLQQISSCGMTIAYTLSVISLLLITYKQTGRIAKIPCFALMSCLCFAITFVRNACLFGVTPLILFIVALLAGAFMFYYTQHHHQSS
jgi:amino acid transporter